MGRSVAKTNKRNKAAKAARACWRKKREIEDSRLRNGEQDAPPKPPVNQCFVCGRVKKLTPLYCFPHDADILDCWKKFLGIDRASTVPIEDHRQYLCEKHFSEHDFNVVVDDDVAQASTSTTVPTTKTLRKYAIPSYHPTKDSRSTRPPSKRRKKDQDDVVIVPEEPLAEDDFVLKKEMTVDEEGFLQDIVDKPEEEYAHSIDEPAETCADRKSEDSDSMDMPLMSLRRTSPAELDSSRTSSMTARETPTVTSKECRPRPVVPRRTPKAASPRKRSTAVSKRPRQPSPCVPVPNCSSPQATTKELFRLGFFEEPLLADSPFVLTPRSNEDFDMIDISRTAAVPESLPSSLRYLGNNNSDSGAEFRTIGPITTNGFHVEKENQPVRDNQQSPELLKALETIKQLQISLSLSQKREQQSQKREKRLLIENMNLKQEVNSLRVKLLQATHSSNESAILVQ